MKKIILSCILILVILFVFIQPLFAQTSYTQTPRDRQTIIALLNFLATQTALVQKYQEDAPTLEDIYNRIESDTQPHLFGDAVTRSQIISTFNSITNFQIYDIRRERIRVTRERARARAIQQAVPSPVFFLSLTNNIQNPLALVTNIAGMAAQSVTSYMSATEQADLNAFIELSQLSQDQKGAVNTLRSSMYNYMSRTAAEFGLNEDFDTVSRAAITAFINNTTNQNTQHKLDFLLQRQATYQNYYPYWLDLANTYFDRRRYRDCLDAIAQYEAIRIPIFRPNCDYDYAQTLSKGIVALSHVYSGREYINRCRDFLQKIEANVPDTEWAIRYTAALAYYDLAAKTQGDEQRQFLTRAYRLLRGNIVTLIPEEIASVKRYIQPLNPPAEDNFEYVNLKKAHDIVDKARKTELPPFNYALYANFFALNGIMEQLNLPESEKQEIAAMTREVFFIPGFRYSYLNEAPEIAYSNYLSGYPNEFEIRKNVIQRFLKLEKLDLMYLSGWTLIPNLIRNVYRVYTKVQENTRLSFSQFPFIGNTKINLSLPASIYWEGTTFNVSIEEVTGTFNELLSLRRTMVYKVEGVSFNIKTVLRPSFNSYAGLNEFYLGRFRVDAEFELDRRLNLDKNKSYIVTITVNNSGKLTDLIFENFDALNFTEEFPNIFVYGIYEDFQFAPNVDLDSIVKALEGKPSLLTVWGPEKNTVIPGALREFDNYLVSEGYRRVRSNDRTVSYQIAQEYTKNDYFSMLSLFVSYSLIYDNTGVIAVYLEKAEDDNHAQIVIVRPQNRVEFRYYEK